MGVIYYQELLERAKDERSRYFSDLFKLLRRVGSTQPNIHRISEHIFTIKFSDLIDKPWNVNYLSWGASAESIIDYAVKKDYPSDFIDYLKNCLKKAKGGVVKVGDKKNQFIVQSEFLEKVINEVNKKKINVKTKTEQEYIYLVFEHQSIDEFHCETRLLCATKSYSKALGLKNGFEDKLAKCFKEDFWYEVVKEEII